MAESTHPDAQAWTDEPPIRALLAGVERARKLTLWTLIALAAGTAVGWARAPRLFDLLAQPVTRELLAQGRDPRLGYTGLTDPFILYFTISLMCGVLVALPAFASQIWLIVASRVRRRSAFAAVFFVLVATALFLGGVLFCYSVMLPVAVNYLIGVGSEFESAITVRDFLRFTVRLMVALGVAFELPLLTFTAARVGLVSARTLLRWFPYATIVAFVVGAWLSPPDILSQLLVAFPMLGLYLIGVAFAALAGRRRGSTRRP